MSKNLTGKTILITGASSGIGKATAYEFAQTASNLKLILTARRLETLQTVAKDIESQFQGTKVHAVKLDVSNLKEVNGFVDALPEEFKDIDVLVNNAGFVHGMDKVGSIAEEDVTGMINTNVIGLIQMTQTVISKVMLPKDKGDIVNIGSIAGREPYAGGSIYCATKAAVRSFSDSLRRELISTRLRVMNVDPGQVLTEFSVVRFKGDKEKADKVYEGVEPLTPEDIAECIVFACGRRQNVVVADMLLFPSHQAGAGAMHRKQ